MEQSRHSEDYRLKKILRQEKKRKEIKSLGIELLRKRYDTLDNKNDKVKFAV